MEWTGERGICLKRSFLGGSLTGAVKACKEMLTVT